MYLFLTGHKYVGMMSEVSVSHWLLLYNHLIFIFVFSSVLLVNLNGNLIVIYSINSYKYELLQAHTPLSLISSPTVFDN